MILTIISIMASTAGSAVASNSNQEPDQEPYRTDWICDAITVLDMLEIPSLVAAFLWLIIRICFEL